MGFPIPKNVQMGYHVNLSIFFSNFFVNSNEIYAKVLRKLWVDFETFWVSEILTSEDEHFKNGTSNQIEKFR